MVVGLCLIVPLLFVVISAASESPDPWPASFSVPFSASVLEEQIIGVLGELFYDYTQLAERIDFAGGCPAGGKANISCSVIFNASAGYLIQAHQCTQIANVGTVAPDWLSNNLLFNSTMLVNGEKALRYRGGSPAHNWYTSMSTKKPLMLIVEDIYEQWTFASDFIIAPQSPTLFQLPPNCKASSSFEHASSLPSGLVGLMSTLKR